MQLKMSEVDALKALWRCGVATKGQFEHSFGLHVKRLKQFEKGGLIETHFEEVRLARGGIEFCEKEIFLNHRYKTNYRKTLHDLQLMQAYLSLPPATRETWKTEGQLHCEFEKDQRMEMLRTEIEDMGQPFCAVPDGAFYRQQDHGFIAVEVTTKSYSKQRLSQKRRFAELFLNGILIISV